MLSAGFWERAFGGDPDVVGTVVSLDGQSVEVLGVLPPAAAFVAEVDMWLPLRQTAAEFTGWGLSGLGRLSDGVAIGLVVALASSRVVAGMLPRVSPLDPAIYGAVITLLVAVAFAAN
jgi:hypothetical protein